MPLVKYKNNHSLCKAKHMNCIVLVLIAILAIVIHLVNNFFQEKVKIYPTVSSRRTLTTQVVKVKRGNRNRK